MGKKVVVIFIEGDTEVEFYKELVKIMREHCGGRLECNVEIENASGIGQYKAKVIRIFEKRIMPKYPDAQFDIALCYDQDVFELTKNPPINWNDVKKELCNKGAKKVYLIQAMNAIEDWFLYDIDGVLNYLGLPRNTKIPKGRGADKLKALFKKSNKLYIKGNRSVGFVQALNIKQILSHICANIAPLCKNLGVECNGGKKCGDTCGGGGKRMAL